MMHILLWKVTIFQNDACPKGSVDSSPGLGAGTGGSGASQTQFQSTRCDVAAQFSAAEVAESCCLRGLHINSKE